MHRGEEPGSLSDAFLVGRSPRNFSFSKWSKSQTGHVLCSLNLPQMVMTALCHVGFPPQCKLVLLGQNRSVPPADMPFQEEALWDVQRQKRTECVLNAQEQPLLPFSAVC